MAFNLENAESALAGGTWVVGAGQEDHFSWSPCDCCGDERAGNRMVLVDIGPNRMGEMTVCLDCVNFSEYGDIPEEE